MTLLSRDRFREAVFARDKNRCVICGAPAVDAHHIMERRLFPDGGYYLDNGASLCAEHHLSAEQTVLSVEDIMTACRIGRRVTPPHLYPDETYSKWGDVILPNGTRLRGELFDDESVQKVLAQGGMLHLFTKHVKYPRTWHLPWSPGASEDDRVLESDGMFFNAPMDAADWEHGKQVVVTLKMDGENTTWYRDYMHARSIDYAPHPSRDRVKALWAERAFEIPDGWRVCGENLYARHSIAYADLPDWFLAFSVWNDRNECLPWADTLEWAELLGLRVVPTIYRGRYSKEKVEAAFLPYKNAHEGYVVRLEGRFHYRDFRKSVAKYVRTDHVQTHGGWMRQRVVPNQLTERT